VGVSIFFIPEVRIYTPSPTPPFSPLVRELSHFPGISPRAGSSCTGEMTRLWRP
jgi:hypothetical protein